eukprot:CAMPEP_0168340740 /NCGR_PEP_ID=MMETSP0213-20121227/14250_1 /TAXON_ID=151035 /ORGANISM="Euplotes harpa, Strain FSP1.4" /LENGTH=258 /DNA_ID=CAMNT_0008347047 /DNA_START=280 /DNA_END=1058 /DNA_ORIENTATION=+
MMEKNTPDLKCRANGKHMLVKKNSNNDSTTSESVTSPWLNKTKAEPYDNALPDIQDSSSKRVPMFRTPEISSSKASILDRRPPSFKVNSRVSNVDFKGMQMETASMLETRNNEAKMKQILMLQNKLKSLEKKCEAKDAELESLQKETQKLVKDRDTCAKKFKEYKMKKEQEAEEDDQYDPHEFRRALTEALQAQADDEYPEAEGEGEEIHENSEDANQDDEDPRNYRNMLMAMANHMLAEKLERQELEAAIQMSLNQN